jgi:hypothetical protein
LVTDIIPDLNAAIWVGAAQAASGAGRCYRDWRRSHRSRQKSSWFYLCSSVFIRGQSFLLKSRILGEGTAVSAFDVVHVHLCSSVAIFVEITNHYREAP